MGLSGSGPCERPLRWEEGSVTPYGDPGEDSEEPYDMGDDDDADSLKVNIRWGIAEPSRCDRLVGGTAASASGGGGGSLCVGGALGGCIRDMEAWRITILVIEADASSVLGISEDEVVGDFFHVGNWSSTKKPAVFDDPLSVIPRIRSLGRGGPGGCCWLCLCGSRKVDDEAAFEYTAALAAEGATDVCLCNRSGRLNCRLPIDRLNESSKLDMNGSQQNFSKTNLVASCRLSGFLETLSGSVTGISIVWLFE